MPKRISAVTSIIIALAVGFIGGFYFKGTRIETPVLRELINRDASQPSEVDFSTFWDVWNLLHTKYVDKANLDTQALVYGAIDGLVKTVGDPYTVFLQPKESEEFTQQINGSFSGVGIEIGLRDNVLTVIAPIKDTPAAKAGLLAGDKIVKIDDKSTEGMKLEEAVQLIRGKKGSKIVLTIARKEAENKDVSIIRDDIKIPAVAWELIDDNTARLEVFVFNKNVDSEFRKAADEIAKSNADRIILDLRNNPGGLLDSAINLASYFLDPDLPVTIERFGDGAENIFRTRSNGQLKDYPLIVLVNKGSASASEILAGALKDNRGVTIVGETSFGKGSVQEIAELARKASLKITIAKWLTPNGTSINDNGIEPDVLVEVTEEDIKNEKDPQLDKAKELIKNLK
ncbi:MAG: S41 family peptidase [Candidatus Paceibacterota bacterium]